MLSATKIERCVNKSTSSDETAPSAKHVDRLRSNVSWSMYFKYLLKRPLDQNEVVCFKGLIVTHYFFRTSFPCLKEGLYQIDFFKGLETIWSRRDKRNTPKGYGQFNSSYAGIMAEKLTFHQKHNEFDGEFSFSNFRLKFDEKRLPNGEASDRIMSILKRLIELQKSILDLAKVLFENKPINSLKLPAIVQLRHESNNMYNCEKYLLDKLCDVLDNTRQVDFQTTINQFNSQFPELRKLYDDAAAVNYVTTLKHDLPQEPPVYTPKYLRGDQKADPKVEEQKGYNPNAYRSNRSGTVVPGSASATRQSRVGTTSYDTNVLSPGRKPPAPFESNRGFESFGNYNTPVNGPQPGMGFNAPQNNFGNENMFQTQPGYNQQFSPQFSSMNQTPFGPGYQQGQPFAMQQSQQSFAMQQNPQFQSQAGQQQQYNPQVQQNQSLGSQPQFQTMPVPFTPQQPFAPQQNQQQLSKPNNNNNNQAQFNQPNPFNQQLPQNFPQPQANAFSQPQQQPFNNQPSNQTNPFNQSSNQPQFASFSQQVFSQQPPQSQSANMNQQFNQQQFNQQQFNQQPQQIGFQTQQAPAQQGQQNPFNQQQASMFTSSSQPQLTQFNPLSLSSSSSQPTLGAYTSVVQQGAFAQQAQASFAPQSTFSQQPQQSLNQQPSAQPFNQQPAQGFNQPQTPFNQQVQPQQPQLQQPQLQQPQLQQPGAFASQQQAHLTIQQNFNPSQQAMPAQFASQSAFNQAPNQVNQQLAQPSFNQQAQPDQSPSAAPFNQPTNPNQQLNQQPFGQPAPFYQPSNPQPAPISQPLGQQPPFNQSNQQSAPFNQSASQQSAPFNQASGQQPVPFNQPTSQQPAPFNQSNQQPAPFNQTNQQSAPFNQPNQQPAPFNQLSAPFNQPSQQSVPFNQPSAPFNQTASQQPAPFNQPTPFNQQQINTQEPSTPNNNYIQLPPQQASISSPHYLASPSAQGFPPGSPGPIIGVVAGSSSAPPPPGGPVYGTPIIGVVAGSVPHPQ